MSGTDTPKAGGGAVSEDEIQSLTDLVFSTGSGRLADIWRRIRVQRLAPSPAPLATGGEVREELTRIIAMHALTVSAAGLAADKIIARYPALATSPTRVGDGELRGDGLDPQTALEAVVVDRYRRKIPLGISETTNILAALRASDPGGGELRDKADLGAFVARHTAPCRRAGLSDAEFRSIVEHHPAFKRLVAPPPRAAGGRGDEGAGS